MKGDSTQNKPFSNIDVIGKQGPYMIFSPLLSFAVCSLESLHSHWGKLGWTTFVCNQRLLLLSRPEFTDLFPWIVCFIWEVQKVGLDQTSLAWLTLEGRAKGQKWSKASKWQTRSISQIKNVKKTRPICKTEEAWLCDEVRRCRPDVTVWRFTGLAGFSSAILVK